MQKLFDLSVQPIYHIYKSWASETVLIMVIKTCNFSPAPSQEKIQSAECFNLKKYFTLEQNVCQSKVDHDCVHIL